MIDLHHLTTVFGGGDGRRGERRLSPPVCNNRGALLISLILTLTVMAVLGAAMVYMTASSSHSFLSATGQQKAYYLAYSGLTFYDAQPVKPALPQTYHLANGDRFVLDVEGVPERLISTGIVAGPYGDIRYKLTARGAEGSPEWVDTMEDTGSWQPDVLSPGSLETAVVEDNAALRTVGESFDLPGAGSAVSLQTAIDDAAAIRDDYESRRSGSDPFSLEWRRNDFYVRYWSAVVGALEDARAILMGAGVADDTVILPTELSQPRVFGAFDWRTVNSGGPIPFFDYWNSSTYDGIPHDPHSLSYDLQVKTAVLPNTIDYLSGLSLRLDDTPVVRDAVVTTELGHDHLAAQLDLELRNRAQHDRVERVVGGLREQAVELHVAPDDALGIGQVSG